LISSAIHGYKNRASNLFIKLKQSLNSSKQ
jgi:hypothetical protein